MFAIAAGILDVAVQGIVGDEAVRERAMRRENARASQSDKEAGEPKQPSGISGCCRRDLGAVFRMRNFVGVHHSLTRSLAGNLSKKSVFELQTVRFRQSGSKVQRKPFSRCDSRCLFRWQRAMSLPGGESLLKGDPIRSIDEGAGG